MRSTSFFGPSGIVFLWLLGWAASGSGQTGLQLNEVLAKNVTHTNPITRSVVDWVEIRNRSHREADLGSLVLARDLKGSNRWHFPVGVKLSPGAYLVVELDKDRPPSVTPSATLNAGFAIRASGDTLLLLNDVGGQTAIVDQVQFGVQAADLSIGRNSAGDLWELGVPTPASENLPIALGDSRKVKINEWMAAPGKGDDWIELYNQDTVPVALGGLFLSDSSGAPFRSPIHPLSFIGTGTRAFAVLIADDGLEPGHLRFRLGANGETLILSQSDGTRVDQVEFGRQVPNVSEGRFPDGSTRFTRLIADGTPGRPNLLPIPGIVFSEILSHTDDPLEDAIELQNLQAESVDISGWFLTDNPDRPKKYRIPPGTIMDPGGFAVFYRYQFQPTPGVFPSFGFNSAHGDDLFLYEADERGNLTGRRISEEFASAPNGVSFGRYDTSVGAQFGLMDHITLGTEITATSPPEQTPLFRLGRGASNSLSAIGPLAISEIMYQPRESGATKGMEFIEIRNLTLTNVSFYDLIFFTNTYRLGGDIEYQWPTNSLIRSGEAVLVVGFDPVNEPQKLNAFRELYSVPQAVQIFGPFAGDLDNSGGTIQLYRPDIPQFCFDPDFGFVAPILVDRVRYRQVSPWPSAAAGNGNSIQRARFDRFGDDPVHWYAGAPSAGIQNGPPAGRLPQVHALPHEQPTIGSNLTLKVVDELNDSLTQFQWRLNGRPVEGMTTPGLAVTNLSPRNSGRYSVLASNPYGATNIEFEVTVLAPPVITRSPADLQLPAGDTAILSVTAVGTPPFSYQWTKNGVPLPQATNAILILRSLSPQDVGMYAVTVATSQGQAVSSSAAVALWSNRPPRVVQQPKGEDFRTVTPVKRGDQFRLEVVASGEPPLQYRWRRNGEPIPGANRDSYLLTDFEAEDLGAYDVEISNSFGSTLSDVVRFGFLDIPTVEILTPERMVVNPGEDVSFPTQSTGTPRLYYQWRHNGQDIPAELCADYTRYAVSHAAGGYYQVRCWNKRGEVILGTGYSKTVELIVRPVITAIQRDGSRITLRFEAQGSQHYRLEASLDLSHWQAIGEVTTRLGTNHSEAGLLDGNARFFRLIDTNEPLP